MDGIGGIPGEHACGRLLDPLLDALKLTGASKTDAGLVIKVVLRHMQRRGCSFWKWTESEWGDIVHNTVAGFEQKNTISARSRPYLMAVCILLGRISELRHLGNFDRAGLATKGVRSNSRVLDQADLGYVDSVGIFVGFVSPEGTHLIVRDLPAQSQPNAGRYLRRASQRVAPNQTVGCAPLDVTANLERAVRAQTD